jgi:hypothetical protein
MTDFTKNQQELDRFFRAILEGKLTPEQVNKQAFTYFGEQGPWYTVGWKMAVTIERGYGRKRLVEIMCNTAALPSTYNAAAKQLSAPGGESLPHWSEEIIHALEPAAKWYLGKNKRWDRILSVKTLTRGRIASTVTATLAPSNAKRQRLKSVLPFPVFCEDLSPRPNYR